MGWIRCHLTLLAMFAAVTGCGGNDTVDEDCDKPQRYQAAVEGKRVVVPEGLDPLNEFSEMPIPKADPDAPEPPPGRCVDSPPPIGLGN